MLISDVSKEDRISLNYSTSALAILNLIVELLKPVLSVMADYGFFLTSSKDFGYRDITLSFPEADPHRSQWILESHSNWTLLGDQNKTKTHFFSYTNCYKLSWSSFVYNGILISL